MEFGDDPGTLEFGMVDDPGVAGDPGMVDEFGDVVERLEPDPLRPDGVDGDGEGAAGDGAGCSGMVPGVIGRVVDPGAGVDPGIPGVTGDPGVAGDPGMVDDPGVLGDIGVDGVTGDPGVEGAVGEEGVVRCAAATPANRHTEHTSGRPSLMAVTSPEVRCPAHERGDPDKRIQDAVPRQVA